MLRRLRFLWNGSHIAWNWEVLSEPAEGTPPRKGLLRSHLARAQKKTAGSRGCTALHLEHTGTSAGLGNRGAPPACQSCTLQQPEAEQLHLCWATKRRNTTSHS